MTLRRRMQEDIAETLRATVIKTSAMSPKLFMQALFARSCEIHRLRAVRGSVGECQRAGDGAGRGRGELRADGAVSPGRDARPTGITGDREACGGYDAGEAQRYILVIGHGNRLGRAAGADCQ